MRIVSIDDGMKRLLMLFIAIYIIMSTWINNEKQKLREVKKEVMLD